MRPTFHPELLNGVSGDPVLYIDFLLQKRALMFDLGDISVASPRKILRLTHIFVSHTHMDHFIGFDRILRLRVGRALDLGLFGPVGIIDGVTHKLASYTWNLVDSYENDFTIYVTEAGEDGVRRQARFRCREGFTRRECEPPRLADDILLEDDELRVRAVPLDHRVPCLAFALEEREHINIWKTELDAMGLPTGPWLKELKAAHRRGDPDDTPVHVAWRDVAGEHQRTLTLGTLRERIVRIVPGQKVAYVVDTIFNEGTARRIEDLARGADLLFIEAPFLEEDAGRAAATYHLTAAQAGRLGRRAGVVRLVPMHFSPRYPDGGEALYREAMAAFAG